MATTHLPGTMEIDHDRGVIYFHLTSPSDIVKRAVMTPIRISGLPKPIPEIQNRSLDIGFEPVTFIGHFDWNGKDDD